MEPDGRRAVPWMTLALCLAMVLWHLAQLAETPLRAAVAPFGVAPAEALDARLRLVRFGARSTALVADAGEVWRLYSSHFVHTGWLHLLFNLAFFFPAAGAVETLVRRTDYVLAMLVVATAAAVASLAWTPEISAGASGLVFGWLAAAVVLGLLHQERLGPALRPYVGWSVLPFLLLILLVGFTNPAIDHASHLGGLAGGALAAPFLRLRPELVSRRIPPPPSVGEALRIFAVGGAALVALAIASPIATHGAVPAAYRVEDSVQLTPPTNYVPRFDELGRVIFQGHTRLVRVSIEVVDGRDEDPRARFMERRVDPLIDSGILEPLAASDPRPGPEPARCDSYLTRRRRHPVGLRTCDVRVGRSWVVVGIETPAEWRHKYVGAEALVLGSLRPARPAGPGRSGTDVAVVSAAVP